MRPKGTRVIFINASKAEADWIKKSADRKAISMTEFIRRIIAEKMDAEGIQN
jgi:hypothetical protein